MRTGWFVRLVAGALAVLAVATVSQTSTGDLSRTTARSDIATVEGSVLCRELNCRAAPSESALADRVTPALRDRSVVERSEAGGSESECRSIDVRLSEDACGSQLAISLRGNARSSSPGSCSAGVVGCIAVSGTKDASTQAGSCGVGSLVGVHCVAVSGTGNAGNTAGEGCAVGILGARVACLAVSGLGNASNTSTGDCASGYMPGVAVGCIAVSGRGDAANTSSRGYCGLGVLGFGAGCIAVSGTGNASNWTHGWCADGSLGVGVGCIAVSGTGQATNYAGWGCLYGVAVGCIAIGRRS